MGKLFKDFKNLCTDFDHILLKEGKLFKGDIIQGRILIKETQYEEALILGTLGYKYECSVTFSIKIQFTWILNFSSIPMTMLESKAWLIAIRTIKSSFIVLILFQTHINMNLVIVTKTMITKQNQSTMYVNAICVWHRITGRGPHKTWRFLIPQTTMP